MVTEGWTYGCELEWSDVDRSKELSWGAKWSSSDYTIVNSCGVANDPTGRLHILGGEVNTSVSGTIDGLAEEVQLLHGLLHPTINYRSNLHVHIGVPGLHADLDALKRIAQVIPQTAELIDVLDPLSPLLTDQPQASRGPAQKRLNHSTRSRHLMYSTDTLLERLDAPSVDRFLAAGPPAFGARECINLRSLKKHGTIEFRHFAGTSDPGDVYEAARWARDWLEAALNGTKLPDPRMYEPPTQLPFVRHLEHGWRLTNLHTNKRADVYKTLLRWQRVGSIPRLVDERLLG